MLLLLGSNAFGFRETAEAIAGLLEGLHAKDVVMVGYSLGARLALYLAEKHGHRLGTVVSISGSTGIKGTHLAFGVQVCSRYAVIWRLATRMQMVHIICCCVWRVSRLAVCIPPYNVLVITPIARHSCAAHSFLSPGVVYNTSALQMVVMHW